MKPTILHSKLLETAGVIHGFTERSGGVSPPPTDSLNTKVSPLIPDSIDNVASNLSKIFNSDEQAFTNCKLLYLDGDSKVIQTNNNSGSQTVYRADGAVSTTHGQTLAITVADCLPILLVDKPNGVVGISHAGWKGSADKITTKVLKKMKSFGADPEKIIAAVGPGICGRCYEVGEEVSEQFDEKFIKKGAQGKYLLDLVQANIFELRSFGVENIDYLNICTYENTDRFFSARKDGETGRFLAYIKL